MHVQEVKQVVRDDQVKKSPQKVVKENNKDTYDFWKTAVYFDLKDMVY